LNFLENIKMMVMAGGGGVIAFAFGYRVNIISLSF
jgi:hypothetical protein